MEKALIDTNILVYYASAKEVEKHEKSRKLMKLAQENPYFFTIALQNIREFANVMHKKSILPISEINEYVFLFAHLFQEIIIDTVSDVQKAVYLNVEKEHDFYDTLLSMTAQRNGIQTIYTENTKDFERIPGIKAVNPLR
ncbi:MAG: PIN domain-containing protein [Candidatus Diapherotrites archaeon]|nr:PIN domain-containing protein [Candidatus Diapherotrites archaeon]